MNNNQETLSEGKVIKASFYYIFCNILLKGVGFLTTPFFSRILTQEEYGYASNFSSWMSLLTVIATLSLIASLIRARFDYEEDYDSYVSSILVLGIISAIIVFGFVFFNIAYFEKLFSLNKKYIILMGVSVIASPAYDIFLQNQRYEYKYRLVTVFTVIVSLSSVGLSFLFVYLWEDNLWGKVLGGQIPTIILSIGIYIYYFKKSHSIKLKYWKYAIPICVPFIFHLLSSSILDSSDRIMITGFCGPSDNALYSMAYNIGMIVSLLWSSMNQAFAPWLGEKIHTKDYNPIRKVSGYYFITFVFLVFGMMLIAPEILLVLGGKRYYSALNIIPSVMLGYVIVFMDSLYVNILQFEKKTFGMACATLTAAITNAILNYILIPKLGYKVAAYTTVISYMVLFIFDYLLVRKITLNKIYDTSKIFSGLLMMLCLCGLSFQLYIYSIIRYSIIIIYTFICIYLLLRYKIQIYKFIK